MLVVHRDDRRIQVSCAQAVLYHADPILTTTLMQMEPPRHGHLQHGRIHRRRFLPRDPRPDAPQVEGRKGGQCSAAPRIPQDCRSLQHRSLSTYHIPLQWYVLQLLLDGN